MSKLYVWVNSKLSPLQKGLQSAHVVAELTRVYLVQNGGEQADRDELTSWLDEKTIVILEGGSTRNLQEMLDHFNDMPNDDNYPYESFDEPDLDSILTAVGIVLDSDWDLTNRDSLRDWNDWEQGLLLILAASEAR